MSNKPSVFIGWRHNGINSFEVVSTAQFKPFLEKLVIEEGVNVASIFISKMAMCNWLTPDSHKGCRQVQVQNFYDEINGTGNPSDYHGPDVSPQPKKSDSKYGYIRPDGKYFQCEYFGHSALERELVGKLEDIDDPQAYLFSKGWLCIYHDPLNHGQYAIAMGNKKSFTNEQLATLERLKIPHTSRGFQEHLLGED